MESNMLGRAHCSQSCGLHRASTLPLATSSSCAAPRRTHRRSRDTASRALFDPPPFKPEMLTVMLQDSNGWPGSGSGASISTLQPPVVGCPAQSLPKRRRYTLTHNDITGALRLSVGSDYNHKQISGFYTRLLRDEVIAEWVFNPAPSLHVYCHVSGEERWLAPPPLRNYIFRRELPLVLDTFMYADRELLQQRPELQSAEVFVHFQSTLQELNTVERWGVLGQRHTWIRQESMLKRMLMAVTGWHLPAQQQQQQQSSTGQQPLETVSPHSPLGQASWPVQAPVAASVVQPNSRQAQSAGLYGSSPVSMPPPVPVIAAVSIVDPVSQTNHLAGKGSLPSTDGLPGYDIPLQPSLTSVDDLGGVLAQTELQAQEPVLVLASASSLSVAASSNGNGMSSNGRSSSTGGSSASSTAASSALRALRADNPLGISVTQLQPAHVVVAAQPPNRTVDGSRGPGRLAASGKARSGHRRRS